MSESDEPNLEMSWSDLKELGWLGLGLPRFLRHPITVDDARQGVTRRNVRRSESFLGAVESLIYRQPRSPVRRLLSWAGWELEDLQRSVRQDGIESTLEGLRRQGVFFSSDELRGEVPIRRGRLDLHVKSEDFDNPLQSGALRGSTSGSTSRSVPVRYSWKFLAEEAENELLLLESHALAAAPLAMWLPGPPGIAGLHNQLLHARTGRHPVRWFSQSRCSPQSPASIRLVDFAIRASARLLRRFGPAPEWVPFDRAEEVARWLNGSSKPSVLKAFASSLTRVAEVAAQAGLDLSGHVVFAGGEPLTLRGRELLERAGLRVYPRFVTTESGLLAGSCPQSAGDEMHIYTDRVAIVGAAGLNDQPGPLAVTSLSIHAPKVLFNAELGDHGVLRRHPCDCALGAAGLDQHVAAVCSPERISAAGIKLGIGDFVALLEQVVEKLGGAGDQFQLWLGEDHGGSYIRIAIAPEAPFSEELLMARVKERLPELRSGRLAASQWEDSGALTVLRAPLRLSPGQKLARVMRDESQEPV